MMIGLRPYALRGFFRPIPIGLPACPVEIRPFNTHTTAVVALSKNTLRLNSGDRMITASNASIAQATISNPEEQVLSALRTIIDPDFGEDIVACGFVKELSVDPDCGLVALTLELTTPACPVKEVFRKQANETIRAIPWVKDLDLTMTAQPARPITPESGRPGGLQNVINILAVSSCKGGVGKSTVAVNLAYTLAQMGAKVGIFDADVYGPSLPLMVTPEIPILEMDPETKAIKPTEYEGVKVVSFGFAGQGSAIMRGPMVSGLITQMLTTAQWGNLDYLVVDFPPGTGDIQLTLCQTVAFSAAVIVTTPQKMAFIDVAKGIRMFAKLVVPCVAVVENMSYFEAEGKRYFPFGSGSGERIQQDFGLPNLVRFPIVQDLSAAGDGGRPLVVSDPLCSTSRTFMELGASVVREVAKMRGGSQASARGPSVYFDSEQGAIRVKLPGEASHEEYLLSPVTLRRNDTSATSVNEWTGQRMGRDEDIPVDITPTSINPLGNYAVQINWEDGFSQVASFELLSRLRSQAVTKKLSKAVSIESTASSPSVANAPAATVSSEIDGMLATAELQ
ncbi:hypothetical protein CEUSTIGMA_g2376.t1 [Chlamydomonas eustigma]|uniref:MIP18 family-like domain-containing protein n=1 Tax=Chlamydomonas eustigma TaxID=1157962 RepID=A0A250WWM8_9CHLO|nr:hypothetical protein CEUSTIGMA_g2376.t1 [Chlamydomonas eustigma]|eukprot:GAX74930.1 hypothetical protein CEUSTIGMA_g2376.t1 [Chlamydomonas eustigma]